MTRYKENPDLKLKIVKTLKGEKEYKKNCRKIRDQYYVIGEDCIKLGEKWYLTASKHITFDYEKKVWVLTKDAQLVYGIVEIKANGTPVFGYFTQNKYNNVLINVPNYGSVYAYNDDILRKGGYAENIAEGVWYFRGNLSSTALLKLAQIAGKKVYTNKGYNCEDNADEFAEKIRMFDAYPLKINTKAARYGKLLGDTSFGCEIETSIGYIPENLQYRTGTLICRDGSIDNAEYVTVPLRGAKGLTNLKVLSELLKERTKTDIKCSFHIHLGTLPTDRLFIVALYALSIRIQDELFTMFPYYKTEWKGIKKQNYNQKTRKLGTAVLPEKYTKEEFEKYINEAYYRIFTFLNDGIPPDDRFNRQTNTHHQNAKWNRKERYYWLNFMNLFFSKRRTAEFRLHQATVNGQKMVNWLFICNAIVRYAEKHSKDILSSSKPIAINEILDYYTDNFKTEDAKFLSEYLKAYYSERKAYFLRDLKNSDYESAKELSQDKDYVFEYKGVSWLF